MSLLKTLLIFQLVGIVGLAQGVYHLPESEKQEIQKTVATLKNAIIQENTKSISAMISRSGLTCTDTKYSYSQVIKYLNDKQSHLYMSLFNSVRYFKLCGSGYPTEYPAISEKEFLLKSTNPTIEIIASSPNSVQVVYKSSTKGHYKREWYFQKEAGLWKFADGFIVGGCFCG